MKAARDKVLVFHGIGGVDTSPLSGELEAALTRSERRPAQRGEPGWAGEPIVPSSGSAVAATSLPSRSGGQPAPAQTGEGAVVDAAQEQ